MLRLSSAFVIFGFFVVTAHSALAGDQAICILKTEENLLRQSGPTDPDIIFRDHIEKLNGLLQSAGSTKDTSLALHTIQELQATFKYPGLMRVMSRKSLETTERELINLVRDGWDRKTQAAASEALIQFNNLTTANWHIMESIGSKAARDTALAIRYGKSIPTSTKEDLYRSLLVQSENPHLTETPRNAIKYHLSLIDQDPEKGTLLSFRLKRVRNAFVRNQELATQGRIILTNRVLSEGSEVSTADVREFDLFDILSLATGRNLSETKMKGVQDILDFVSRTHNSPMDMAAEMDVVKPWILNQYPELGTLDGEELKAAVQSHIARVQWLEKHPFARTLKIVRYLDKDLQIRAAAFQESRAQLLSKIQKERQAFEAIFGKAYSGGADSFSFGSTDPGLRTHLNRSPFDVLGLDKDATWDQVQAAFRKLAFKFHPDTNGGDESHLEQMKEANEAYQVLKSHFRIHNH